MDQPVELAPEAPLPVDDAKKGETMYPAQVKEASMTESEVTNNSVASAPPHTARHRQSLNIGRDREENLKNIQFIEPEEGTPAALALAGKLAFVLLNFLFILTAALYSKCCYRCNKV